MFCCGSGKTVTYRQRDGETDMWKPHQRLPTQSRQRCGRRGQRSACVLTGLHLWYLLLCATTAGADSQASQCQYRMGVRGQGSVLRVSLEAPLPPVYGYYVLVESLQDPHIFFEHSQQLKEWDGRVVYEVYGIPSHGKHSYQVRMRPHGKNPGKWLGGYRQVCVLDIPPPPPPPDDDAPPPPAPDAPPALPDAPDAPDAPPDAPPGLPRGRVSSKTVMLSAGQTPEQEIATPGKGQTSEGGGPSLVMIGGVMAGVVTLCLLVCLAVWWRWGAQHRGRGKKPDHSTLPWPSDTPAHKRTHGEPISDVDGARREHNCPGTCPRCALMTRTSSAIVSAGRPAYHGHHSLPQHHQHHRDYPDYHYDYHGQPSDSFSVSVSEISCSDCNDV